MSESKAPVDAAQPSFSTLPTEIKQLVASHLSVQSNIALALTSKQQCSAVADAGLPWAQGCLQRAIGKMVTDESIVQVQHHAAALRRCPRTTFVPLAADPSQELLDKAEQLSARQGPTWLTYFTEAPRYATTRLPACVDAAPEFSAWATNLPEKDERLVNQTMPRIMEALLGRSEILDLTGAFSQDLPTLFKLRQHP